MCSHFARSTWDFSGFSLSNLFVFIFFFLFDSSSSSCLAHGLHVLQKVSSLTFCSTSTHSDREWNLGSFESVRDSPTSSLYPAPYLHPTEGHRHSKHHLSLGWKCPTSLGLYPTKRSALRNDRLSTTNLSCGCTPPHTLTFKS